MKKSVNVVFLGGDDRAAYAAEYLCQKGYEVGYCRCQSQKFSSAVKIESVSDAAKFADAIVLPIPVTRDGEMLAYSDGVLLPQIAESIPKNKKMLVFGGMIPTGFEQKLGCFGAAAVDYSKEEAYLQSSADLTALAFWDFVKDKGFASLDNKRIAVCGLGRIGKRLVLDLCRRNARITVLSGKADAHAGSYPENVSFCHYKDAKNSLCECGAVINTAPAHVLDINAVKSIPKDGIFYELASAPFGIDGECAQYLGTRYVKASGLPGIYYPKKSGELIALSVIGALHQKCGL